MLTTLTILSWLSISGYAAWEILIKPKWKERQVEEEEWWEEVLSSIPAEDEESAEWRYLNEKAPEKERKSKRHEQNKVLLEALAAKLPDVWYSSERAKTERQKAIIKRLFEAAFKRWWKKYDPSHGTLFVEVKGKIYPVADIFPATMEVAYYPKIKGNLKAVSYYSPDVKLILPNKVLNRLQGFVEKEARTRYDFHASLVHKPSTTTSIVAEMKTSGNTYVN